MKGTIAQPCPPSAFMYYAAHTMWTISRLRGCVPFLSLVGLLGTLFQISPVIALETEILSLKLAEKPIRLFTEGPRAFLLNGKGGNFHIGLKGGKLVLNVKEKNNIKGKRPAGILPDGDITYGNRNIKAAWLTGTTRRYDHGVLGDDIEATGMAIELAGGRRLELKLGPQSVFEDRLARLADLDGDGKDEIIAVRSYLDKGAALAVAKPGPQGLRIIAETWPIGIPHRWLNSVGVGNFDGNGRAQVALVKTPHIGGKLEIYALESGSLRLKGKPAIFQTIPLANRNWGRGRQSILTVTESTKLSCRAHGNAQFALSVSWVVSFQNSPGLILTDRPSTRPLRYPTWTRTEMRNSSSVFPMGD